MKIYTRRGDDGSTALGNGARVSKDSPLPEAYGAVDEAQAVLGLVRAEAEAGGELAELVEQLERDLWQVMGELAGAARGEGVTPEMITRLEAQIDSLSDRFELPQEFVVPGENRLAALLDHARTVARRAERRVLASGFKGEALAYLNRLSDLLWVMARWQAGESLPSRD
ncbi:MAG: ATP:cob(I)alamin adenosyltransferase [Euryarchaeota archaeon]|nr:ATP:cob(I)alamin adenosyltransferase [Euryarchaeota archaeon]MDP6363368.1 cob(I)yrinic acid a,c-diamide adenosyltransferase [Candidatus Poseidoniia archaeon]MDP6658242.1 cob(I)yrinic acid a,c-diamide adenosyltransferase [Candidatus Poseidoniia archaeon]MDP6846100.1 cob(I)yrinic acid a,c-diamide adenosyltransferase [Candidatus Poseidoniia archaeon]MDP7007404.1 cob(I)yrinic acid a,c-diamide adenosyltransferase [Candidatus Poseidoniia archaeon]